MIYNFRGGDDRVSAPPSEWQWGWWVRLPKLRGRMSITLYGSYYPRSELRLLERQRDRLVGAGYVLTGLVKDGPDDGIGPLAASKRYLENSDVNFLIFTKAGKRYGLIRELAHVAEALTRSKVLDCVVFDQIVDGRSSVPDLSMCDLRDGKIPRHAFHDESDLSDALLTRAEHHVFDKQDMLARRLST